MSRTKSKNGNGQGSIFFNKSKKIWVGQYTVYGKRKTLYQRKNETKKNFVVRFTKIINDINQGTFIDKIDKTFIEILREHVENKFLTNKVIVRTYLRDLETVKQIENTCADIVNNCI